MSHKIIENTISEIKNLLQGGASPEYMAKLKKDPRQGVQKLVKSYIKQQERERKEQERLKKMWHHEEECKNKGYHIIAGVDEVGRGPLAGPVVAAAVILPSNFDVTGMKDSKQLTHTNREKWRIHIEEHAVSIGIGSIDVDFIDKYNILQATYEAMRIAITQLAPCPHVVLVDAVKIPHISIPQKNIIKGDELSHSIAAASIIAKTTRDEYMIRLSQEYPHYALDQHMGYGTSQHLEAIKKYGPSPIHRRSFSLVAEKIGR